MSRTDITKVTFTPALDVLIEEFGLAPASVFGKVWRYCQMPDGICRASVERMAKELRMTPKTFRKHMKPLVKAGYLEDTTKGLRNKPHIYRDTGLAMKKHFEWVAKREQAVETTEQVGKNYLPGRENLPSGWVKITDEDSKKTEDKTEIRDSASSFSSLSGADSHVDFEETNSLNGNSNGLHPEKQGIESHVDPDKTDNLNGNGMGDTQNPTFLGVGKKDMDNLTGNNIPVDNDSPTEHNPTELKERLYEVKPAEPTEEDFLARKSKREKGYRDIVEVAQRGIEFALKHGVSEDDRKLAMGRETVAEYDGKEYTREDYLDELEFEADRKRRELELALKREREREAEQAEYQRIEAERMDVAGKIAQKSGLPIAIKYAMAFQNTMNTVIKDKYIVGDAEASRRMAEKGVTPEYVAKATRQAMEWKKPDGSRYELKSLKSIANHAIKTAPPRKKLREYTYNDDGELVLEELPAGYGHKGLPVWT